MADGVSQIRIEVSSSGTSHCKMTERVSKIWVIGDSYVRQGEEAAHEKFGKKCPSSVVWKGRMHWSGVLPRFYAELAKHRPPNILVLHADDLGLVSSKKLAFLLQMDLKQLHAEFPSMKIAFPCISERQVWRTGKPVQINNDRKSINRLVRKNVQDFWFK